MQVPDGGTLEITNPFEARCIDHDKLCIKLWKDFGKCVSISWAYIVKVEEIQNEHR